MKTAKIGAIFLISVMALAGVGAGYAAWFDTITIQGTVNTGDVDLVIKRLSNTYVYKDLKNDDIVEIHKFGPYTPPADADYLYVASATTERGADDDSLVITFDKLFPCIDFCADVLFHYEGSIPVKVNFADFDSVFGDEDPVVDYTWLHKLWDLHQVDPEYGIWVEAFRTNPAGVPIDDNGDGIPDPVDVGTQLHYCDYFVVEIHIHLPQYWPLIDDSQEPVPTDDLMNRDGSFTATIEVIQWNEYED